MLGIASTQVQDLALGLVELHEVRMGPPLKPVKVPLDGIPSFLQYISSCSTTFKSVIVLHLETH